MEEPYGSSGNRPVKGDTIRYRGAAYQVLRVRSEKGIGDGPVLGRDQEVQIIRNGSREWIPAGVVRKED